MLSLFCDMIKIIETEYTKDGNRILSKEIKLFSKTIYRHYVTIQLEQNNKKVIGYETEN